MIGRVLWGSLARRPGRKAIATIAVALGTAMVTALIAVAVAAADRVNRELKAYGANLLLLPADSALPLIVGGSELAVGAGAGAGIAVAPLIRIKDIFWRNNVVAFAPRTETRARLANGSEVAVAGTWIRRTLALPGGENFSTGAAELDPSLHVPAAWDDNGAERDAALVGARLAARHGIRAGQTLTLSRSEATGSAVALRVAGIVANGGDEEEQVLVPIESVWALAGGAGKAQRVHVSALTNPESERAGRDPARMSPEEYDRWYCTPYASSIAHQLAEALPGTRARVVRQIAETEGRVLERLRGLLRWISFAVLAAAVLGVASAMTSTILERQREVGLMRALGAETWQVALLFGGEALAIGALGGIAGFALGAGLARWAGTLLLGRAVVPAPLLLPLAIGVGIAIAAAGSALPVRRALRVDPVLVLKGR